MLSLSVLKKLYLENITDSFYLTTTFKNFHQVKQLDDRIYFNFGKLDETLSMKKINKFSLGETFFFLINLL